MLKQQQQLYQVSFIWKHVSRNNTKRYTVTRTVFSEIEAATAAQEQHIKHFGKKTATIEEISQNEITQQHICDIRKVVERLGGGQEFSASWTP